MGSVKDELLVFGYACKVFRDDERARSLDRGVHLIPWMGDESIRMDRYDGRGHLHDLSEYDAEYTWNRSYDLSEEEARIEALCDVERYLALTTNLLDEEARHEEEYKRLHQELAEDGAYRAVGFSYGDEYYDPTQPTEEEDAHPKLEKNPEPEVNEEPFIAPEELKLPSGMEVPATFKTHAIVERTAGFVCKQGTQFEIMLKKKQARNSQFDFLRFDHYLNPYYKHILKRMKDGKYTHIPDPKQQQQQHKAKDEEEEDDDDDNEGGYLHPSLFASKAQSNSRLEELVKPLTTVDPNHPLMAMALRARMNAAEPADALAQPDNLEKDSNKCVMAMYYGYYVMPDGTYMQGPPPPAPAAEKMSEYAYGAHATTLLAPPPPPGLAPPPLLSSSYLSLPSDATQGVDTTTHTAAIPSVIPPPPDVQPVIDKLAQYVAKNGLEFEDGVRSKNDPRY
uniref:Splicing factor SWAP n=1 Tax=Petromyzon marinus TaxID=7757 RepID=S4RV83_PETMA